MKECSWIIITKKNKFSYWNFFGCQLFFSFQTRYFGLVIITQNFAFSSKIITRSFFFFFDFPFSFLQHQITRKKRLARKHHFLNVGLKKNLNKLGCHPLNYAVCVVKQHSCKQFSSSIFMIILYNYDSLTTMSVR